MIDVRGSAGAVQFSGVAIAVAVEGSEKGHSGSPKSSDLGSRPLPEAGKLGCV